MEGNLLTPSWPATQRRVEGPILAPSPSLCASTPTSCFAEPVPYRAYNPVILNTPFMLETPPTPNSQVALGLLSPSPPSVELYNVNNDEITLRKKKARLRSISCPVAKLLVDE